MAIRIVTADERLKQKSAIKGVIFGGSGIGKTSLLRTLDPKTTLALDLEAGMLAVEDWGGDSIQIRDWETARNFACWIGGPNPAMRPDQPYSPAHYEHVCGEAMFGAPSFMDKYETVFIDSITVAGRLCLQWSKGQPQAFSEKTGKPDTRGAYGLHGQELVGWLTQFQHTPGKNIWFVGILDKKKDDFERTFFQPQIDGGKAGLELPGVVDQVISMSEVDFGEQGKHRAFVCHTINQWGYPAKDRSGRLECVEEPHLGKLMAKIKGGARRDALVQTGLPAEGVAA